MHTTGEVRIPRGVHTTTTRWYRRRCRRAGRRAVALMNDADARVNFKEERSDSSGQKSSMTARRGWNRTFFIHTTRSKTTMEEIARAHGFEDAGILEAYNETVAVDARGRGGAIASGVEILIPFDELTTDATTSVRDDYGEEEGLCDVVDVPGKRTGPGRAFGPTRASGESFGAATDIKTPVRERPPVDWVHATFFAFGMIFGLVVFGDGRGSGERDGGSRSNLRVRDWRLF